MNIIEKVKWLKVSDVWVYNFIEHLIKKNKWKVNILRLKGSRWSGKTHYGVRKLTNAMIKDPNASFFVVMTNRKDNSDKTLKWYKDYLEEMGFVEELDYRVFNNTTKIEIEFYANGRKQRIVFLGLDEVSTAGGGRPDGLGSYYIGAHWEELTNNLETAILDFEAKKLKVIGGRKHLLFTYSRFLPANISWIDVYTFNAPNENDPLLEDTPEDNEELLEQQGFTYFYNEKTKTLDITTNYLLLLHLMTDNQKQLFEDMKLDREYYKVYGLGMKGTPAENFFSKIMWKIKKYQNNRYKPEHFTDFRFGLDVGNGSAPSALTMFGFNEQKRKWIGLGEYEVNKLNSIKVYDPDETALAIWRKVKEWLKLWEAPARDYIMRIDNDLNFNAVLDNAWRLHFRNEYDFGIIKEVFTEKYQGKEWSRDLRPNAWYNALSSGKVEIIEFYQPELYNSIRNVKVEQDKLMKVKFVKDGGAHLLESAEMGLYDEMLAIPQVDRHFDTSRVDKEFGIIK